MTEIWNRALYSAENCSIARTLDLVGDKWTIPILRECFFGVSRFSDFERYLGCARNLLSSRLTGLVDAGLLTRADYQEPGRRKRYDYHLSEKGRELLPVLLALMQWGDRWVADAAGPPLRLHHRNCGGELEVRVTCSHGHAALTARDVVVEDGPGAILAARPEVVLARSSQIGRLA
jgi:DNA-binding HxlR family transcriptional regulator